MQSSLSKGLAEASQLAGGRIRTVPAASTCWQVTCLVLTPRPQVEEHLDHMLDTQLQDDANETNTKTFRW